MKKLVSMITAMTIAVSVASVTAITAYAAETTQTTQKTIEVNGKGIITAKPDVASIYLTVETKEKTAEQAQKKNAETTEKVTKAIKALGVRDENIITQYYSIDAEQVYNEQKNKWEEDGYRAYNRFLVKINDVDNVGKYIDAATKAGVTNVGSISFSISDPNQYYKQALQAAVKNASSSAEALAEALGSTLGSCISVEEMSSYNSYEKERAVNNAKSMAFGGEADTAAQTEDGGNIRYEDIEITAGVIMTYAY
ncbi:SIMPL domain-containing protein [Clostridium sp. MD294]|uniref:SIMPL domain-containing protein n=1 Tax=Clostridium sp. MD294 TaxID=97138 RepID=UPI0002CC77D5|nr:SIMPL domain-containing protein [Clostridium sp. MD294]NDO45921.1 DUF541 domain-containing protein [Clostridium sp. MD294]USF30420.1 hypothetical protein C820_001861 [Clostridium sp. MD294]